MAIIYSYPKKSNPQGSDVFIITDPSATSKNKNRTKSVDLDAISAYVITSQSATTGSGSAETIPVFTGPTSLGNSNITDDGIEVAVGVNFRVDGEVTLDDYGSGAITGTPAFNLEVDANGKIIETTASSLTGSGTLNTVPLFTPDGNTLGDSIMAEIGGLINVAGNLSVDNDLKVTGYARFLGEVQDNTNNPGTSGQVLTSTGTGVAWASGVGTVTGTGTTNAITRWQDGANGILEDSILTEDVANTELTCAGDLKVEGSATFDGDVRITANAGSPTLTMGSTNAIEFIDALGTTELRLDRFSGNSVISDTSAGDFILTSNTELEIKSGILGENFAKFTKDGPIELYYDNVKKFETATNSVKILDVPVHADNAAALAAGLVIGELYRTGDLLKIVH